MCLPLRVIYDADRLEWWVVLWVSDSPARYELWDGPYVTQDEARKARAA